MDMVKDDPLFSQLHIEIKEQAKKCLATLVDRIDQIDRLLHEEFFEQQSEPTMINRDSIIRSVQMHLRDFLDFVEHLTLWLELEIPSYTESEEFRIVVQNEILDQMATMKGTALTHLNQFLEYREQRASAKKELFKRPSLDDHSFLIRHLDQQIDRNLKLILIDLKSNLLRISHLLTKNKDFLQQQTSSYHEHVNNYF